MKEMYKVIAYFRVNINLLFINFSKQASTLVALAYEVGGQLFSQIRERFKIVRTKLQNHHPAKLSCRLYVNGLKNPAN